MALPVSSPISQDEINNILWKACDTFRGTVDPSEYKNYILVMLFVKYISDVWQDHFDDFMQKYHGDEVRVRRQLDKDKFKLPDGCSFPSLYAQRNERLKNLLNDFNDNRLDLRPSHTNGRDVIGDAYEYLIGKFASGAGKKAGEFYTPPEVSELLAALVDPQPGDRICDPACGSALIGNWYREQANQIFQEGLRGCYARLAREKIPHPGISIRKMQSSWGSCSARGTISMNIKLIQVPTEYIDYVLIHELCHLKYLHHEPEFYKLLARIMPDWRRKKEKLDRFDFG